jgi:hypothetical protein
MNRNVVRSFCALLLVFVGLFHSRVEACRCLPVEPLAEFAERDAVFSGVVTAIVPEEERIRHVFVEVLEVWKGESPEGALVRVDTSADTASCGFPFQVGETYVIFASNGSDGLGTLSTNLCTATGTVSPSEAAELFGPSLLVNPRNVEFRRADVDGDGAINITDAVNHLLFQFQGTFEPPCREALDFDDNGTIELTDAIGILKFHFLGARGPAEPFPECGKDPDPDPFARVDCERSPSCDPKPTVSEIVRVERVGDGVEIELFSKRIFPARALFPILCIGVESFWPGGVGEDGSLNRLIFTLTSAEFAALQDTSLVTVQHGDQCFLDLETQRLFWDLWVFGPLPEPR